MIVAVKRRDPKKKLAKVISLIALVAMFTAYYFHMSDEFSKTNEKALAKDSITPALTSKTKSKKIERAIYGEVETAIDLIGQEYVQKVRVSGKKILITCDPNTNLEPLMVRYGTMALVKSTLNSIKIAIDLKYIAENKYDGN